MASLCSRTGDSAGDLLEVTSSVRPRRGRGQPQAAQTTQAPKMSGVRSPRSTLPP